MKHGVLLILVMLVLMPHSQAGWFSRKKPAPDPAEEAVQTYQPPPPDAMEVRCEPLRRRIVKMNHNPIFIRAFQGPHVEVLTMRHHKCVEAVEREKLEYMRHVDLQAPPGLKPLEAEPAAELGSP